MQLSNLLAITATLVAVVQAAPSPLQKRGRDLCDRPDFRPVNGDPAYAHAGDCYRMRDLLASRDEEWNPWANRDWHKIAWWGDCAISVQSKSRTGLQMRVGTNDLLEILDGSRQFRNPSNDELGGQGGMSCLVNPGGSNLGVLWKIHRN